MASILASTVAIGQFALGEVFDTCHHVPEAMNNDLWEPLGQLLL